MDGERPGSAQPNSFQGSATNSTGEPTPRLSDFRDFTFTRLMTDDDYDPFEGDIAGSSQSFDDWLSRQFFPPTRGRANFYYIDLPGTPAGGFLPEVDEASAHVNSHFPYEDVTMFEPPMAFEETEEREIGEVTFEELLDIHARIGNVNPGLSDEYIVKNLSRERHQSSTGVGAPVEREPCSICQEEYAEGQDVSKLSCGHEVHFDCIRQWLVKTNSCPLCKRIALAV